MFSRLSGAVFDPRNFIILLPVIILVMFGQVADMVGLIEMNFRFASYVVSLAYLAGVVIHFARPSE